MAWERIEKLKALGKRRPVSWFKVPCVAIGKTQIAFNGTFMSSYGLVEGDILELHLDRTGFRIGLKKQDADTDVPGFKVLGPKGKQNQQAKHITTRHVSQAFPDRVGRVFRATLNPGERIIEVDLAVHEM